MNLVEAHAMNQSVESPIIDNVIEKTMARALQNDRLVESFSPEDRAALQELFEKLSQAGSDFDVETIKTILVEDPLDPDQLLLYAKTFQDWTPVAMTFKEYFSNWYPLYQTLVRD